jgi:hypothetical protein
MAVYVQNEAYNRAAEAIAAIEPCPFAGKVTAEQVKIALGELLDIWPASIAVDAYLAEHAPGRVTVRLRQA